MIVKNLDLMGLIEPITIQLSVKTKSLIYCHCNIIDIYPKTKKQFNLNIKRIALLIEGQKHIGALDRQATTLYKMNNIGCISAQSLIFPPYNIFKYKINLNHGHMF
ncbi:hypothetical protein [Desulfocicer vacuolatum]|uniref:hypothetical protein n=1 Tax=Desulfocicer vacuolatum TaxID=2298 RepID=UPI000A055B5E|nr:hypothetical protein [Desulfocicer vacuolatum]